MRINSWRAGFALDSHYAGLGFTTPKLRCCIAPGSFDLYDIIGWAVKTCCCSIIKDQTSTSKILKAMLNPGSTTNRSIAIESS